MTACWTSGSCSQKHRYFSLGRRVEQLNEGGQIRRKKEIDVLTCMSHLKL